MRAQSTRRWGEGRKILTVSTLLFVSCLNPDDIFPLHGSVSSPGQHVVLQRGQRASRDECGDDFVAFKETDADADGGYLFEIFRAQAESLSTGRRFCFRASTEYASGTSAWGVTSDIEDETTFPLLPDWDAKLHVTFGVDFYPDGGAHSSSNFSFFPVAFQQPSDFAFLPRHSVTLTDADGGVQWRQGDSVVIDGALQLQLNPLNADERITKEFGGGTLRATGSYTRASQVIDGLNADVRVRWSPTVFATSGNTLFIEGPAQIPPSRGAACDGYATCPFTDGELNAVELADSNVTLRFPAPVAASLLVIRGLVTLNPERGRDEPIDQQFVIVAANNADGGGVSTFPGVGGVLASATLNHDFDGPTIHPDGGVAEYPPTYLAIPLYPSEPVSTVHLQLGGLRVEEISVW